MQHSPGSSPDHRVVDAGAPTKAISPAASSALSEPSIGGNEHEECLWRKCPVDFRVHRAAAHRSSSNPAELRRGADRHSLLAAMLPPIAGGLPARDGRCPFDIREVSTALVRGCVKMRARQVLDMPSPPPGWLAIRTVCGLYEHLDRGAVWTGVTDLVEREVAHTALLRAHTCPAFKTVGKGHPRRPSRPRRLRRSRASTR